MQQWACSQLARSNRPGWEFYLQHQVLPAHIRQHERNWEKEKAGVHAWIHNSQSQSKRAWLGFREWMMTEACRAQTGSGKTLQGVKQRACCVICPTGFLPERPRGHQVTAAGEKREREKEKSAQYVTPLQPHLNNTSSTHTCISLVKQWVNLQKS